MTTFDWARSWVPLGTQIFCGDSSNWFFQPIYTEPTYETSALVDGRKLLILLGDPGSGKTTEFFRLQKIIEGSPGITLPFRAAGMGNYPSATISQSPLWQESQTSTEDLTLMIDGIDEVLVSSPFFLDEIIDFIKSHHTHRLRVILSLRAGAWGEKYEKELLPTFNAKATETVFELCPLTRQDAATVFQNAKSDHALKDFFKWLEERDHAPLARLPIFIRQLVQDFLNNPNQPFSLQKLRLRNVERLLRPTGERESKNTELSADRLLSLASLIAVHTILSGHPDFHISNQEVAKSGMLNLNSFFNSPFEGTWECNGAAFAFRKKDLESLLERPLFTTGKVGEHSTWRFSHLTFAEALAAKVLDDQPIARLLQVLGVEAVGRVAPQNERLAAMLAPNSASLRSWLLENQPLVLLRCDATQIPEEEHAAIIQSVFDHIDSSEEKIRIRFLEIDRSYDSKEVGRVLTEALGTSKTPELVKSAALEIAATCPQTNLERTIFQIITDANEEPEIRGSAVHTWLKIAETLPTLPLSDALKIASGEIGTGNPQDCGGVLQFLAKNGVPLRNLLPITPSDEPRFFGRLNTFLDQIAPDIIEVEDLPAAFDFIESIGHTRSYDYDLTALSKKIYTLALENLNHSESLEKFVTHWWSNEKNSGRGPLEGTLRQQLLDLLPKNRQRLILALLHSPDCSEKHPYFAIPIYADDIRWLIESIPEESGPIRHNWLQLIRYNHHFAIDKEVPQWLSKAYDSAKEDFRSAFPDALAGESLQQTLDRVQKEGQAYRAKQEEKQKSFQREHPSYTREKFLRQCKTGFKENPSNVWVHFSQFVHHRFHGDDRPENDNPAHNIRDSLSWKLLDDQNQQRACSAARLFLSEKEIPHPRKGNTNWDIAAYKALDLLREEITPGSDLGIIFRDKWTHSVAPQFNNGEDNHQALMKACKNLDPDYFRQQLRGLLAHNLMLRELPLFLRAYPQSWDNEESRILIEEICKIEACPPKRPPRNSRRKLHGRLAIRKKSELKRAEAVVFAFHFLADNDPESSKKLVQRLIKRCLLPRAEIGVLEPTILLHALLRTPALWRDIWSALNKTPHTQLQSTFRLFVNDLGRDYYDSPWTDVLSNEQIVDFYRLHDRLYPNNPVHWIVGKSRVAAPRDQHIDFEYTVRDVLKKRGMSSEIRSMLGDLLSHERREALRWILREAKETKATAEWTPPSYSEISEWLHGSDGVLVRTANDLLKATMVSLERYQDYLTGEFLVADGWIKEPRQNREKQSYRPSGEEDLSLRISQFLRNDLKTVVITRESAVRVKNSENRTDIEVSIPSPHGPITVIIEHKRAHNTGVATSMESQLVKRYMSTKNCDHGIYLVSWFDNFPNTHKPIKNALRASSPLEAETILREQAVNLKITTNKEVGVIILNCC